MSAMFQNLKSKILFLALLLVPTLACSAPEASSWNRSQPLGYRVTLVRLRDGKAVSYETFAEGWLRGGDPTASPASRQGQ